jgi:hypothetical protein
MSVIFHDVLLVEMKFSAKCCVSQIVFAHERNISKHDEGLPTGWERNDARKS